MAIILLLLLLLAVLPVEAKRNAGDCHMAVEAQFGTGKVLSIAVDNNHVTRIDFNKNTSAQDKTDIQAFCDAYDFTQDGVADVKPGDFEAAIRKGVASGAINANALTLTGQLAKEADPQTRKDLWTKAKANSEFSKWLDAGNISAIETAASNAKMPLK